MVVKAKSVTTTKKFYCQFPNLNTKKWAIVVHVLQNTQNLAISGYCFEDDG